MLIKYAAVPLIKSFYITLRPLAKVTTMAGGFYRLLHR